MQILCPTDFSRPAAAAADVAVAIAAKRQAALKLVYCAADWVAAAELPLTDPADLAAPQQLDDEARRLGSSGVAVSTAILRGSSSREITNAARDDAGMIVMGSTGKGAAERWLVGSVAERVAESAPVPTLVVRRAEPLLAWLLQGRPLRILCGVDFTGAADAAVAVVKQLIQLGPVEVEAAYVPRAEDVGKEPAPEEPDTVPEEIVSLERDVWERLHDALGDMPIEVHVRSAFGSPAFEFVRVADERKADLVVVGTHQRHGLSRLAAPSFSRGVLHHAASNVLCVPQNPRGVELPTPVVRRVLVATDLSPAGNEAMRHAYSLLPSGGTLRVIHVCPAPSSGIDPLTAARVYFDRSLESAKIVEDAEQRLEAIIPRKLATSTVTTTCEAVVADDVASSICEAAERFRADVICMGTKGRSPAAAAVMGSLVQSVIARSHRPVLVVPPAS